MYRVSETTIYVMSKDNPPAMTVRSGDIIVFETRIASIIKSPMELNPLRDDCEQ